MKLWSKIDWLVLIFILLIFVLSFVIAPNLPDQVPTHWNIRGEVDQYGSKYINLLIFPGVALFIFLLMSVLPAIDPFRKNYDKFAKPYQYFKIFMTFFFLYLYFLFLYSAVKGTSFKANLMFGIPFSLFFIFIGWILPQLKRNFFIGIRTPWTLTSDENWAKTHAFGSKLFIAAGVLSLLAVLFGSFVSFIVLISSILAAAIITMVYSYLIFRKNKVEL